MAVGDPVPAGQSQSTCTQSHICQGTPWHRPSPPALLPTRGHPEEAAGRVSRPALGLNCCPHQSATWPLGLGPSICKLEILRARASQGPLERCRGRSRGVSTSVQRGGGGRCCRDCWKHLTQFPLIKIRVCKHHLRGRVPPGPGCTAQSAQPHSQPDLPYRLQPAAAACSGRSVAPGPSQGSQLNCGLCAPMGQSVPCYRQVGCDRTRSALPVPAPAPTNST